MPICFDLDGTLGRFGGGYVLMREALGALWGSAPGPEELRRCRGSTDWEIVEELHRNRFPGALTEAHYARFQDACLTRFREAFPPGVFAHQAFAGPLAALAFLRDRGIPVAVVSGNAPRLLEFKLAVLGVASGVPRLGSLPHHDRGELLLRALDGCGGPHAYVGDRPHDREAAERAGIPFIGVGSGVPGPHPSLPEDVGEAGVLEALEQILNAPRRCR